MSRTLFFAIFLAVVLGVLSGTHYYFYLRLVKDTGLSLTWTRVAKWTLVALSASLVLTFILSRLLSHAVTSIVLFLPYVWMGSMFYLLVLLAGADLVKLVAWAAARASGHAAWFDLEGHRLWLSRLSALVALGGTFIIAVVAIVTAMRAPVIHKVEVALDVLDPALDGLTIVQLSDLHLGPTLGRKYLDDIVERVNKLHPDIIVLTGDLVDGSVKQRFSMLEPLTHLSAPLGKFFVTGNHEFYSDWMQWQPAIEKLGFRLMDNRCLELEKAGARLVLAGVYDFDGARFDSGWAPDLGKALSNCPGEGPIILLSHQARIIKQAAERGVQLVLSGHNHGGQIWPWSYLVLLQQPVITGLHRFGDTQLYVTQGTGFWGPPMRFGTRSEIALISLHSQR
jgi:uncharacterized protein